MKPGHAGAVAPGLAVLLLWVAGTARADGIGSLQAAMREEDQGHIQLSIALYTAAIQDPALSEHNRLAAYYDRATAFELSGDYDQAIGDYSALLQLNPRNAIAWGRRADAWWNEGEVKKAIADYNEALSLEPHNTSLLCARGNVYRGRSDLALALADYSRALQLNPGDPSIYFNRGMAYKDLGDSGHALADFNQAVRLDPKYVKAYFLRAHAYRAAGDLDHALAGLRHRAAAGAAQSDRLLQPRQCLRCARRGRARHR